ncbi:MAG: sulfite exporter TauE/SafE family protein [Polyangiales bacterium]
MVDPRLLVIVTFAFVTESALGFGSSVIVATLGALLGPLDAVMPAFITVNLALSSWVALRARAHIDRALLLREILPLAGLGLALGLAFARVADRPVARAAFGLGVALLAGNELRRILDPRAVNTAIPRARAGLSLFAGGVVHGVFNAGGPLIVYVVSRKNVDKATFRATLSALWLVLNAALIARWLTDGTFTARTARDALWLAPALVLGTALGSALFQRLPPRGFRITAAAVMGAAGLSLTARTLVAMLGG